MSEKYTNTKFVTEKSETKGKITEPDRKWDECVVSGGEVYTSVGVLFEKELSGL